MNGFGAIEWTAVSVIAALVLGFGGVLVRAMDRLNKSEAKADAAEKSAHGATLSATAARLEIERLESELTTHRVEVAREYVSKGTLESLETRIVTAINNLGDRLDRLFTTAAR